MKIFLGLVLLVVVSCKTTETKNIVAQVGGSVLTQDDLSARVPKEYSELLSREQYLDMVHRWMDTEVLYTIALERKLDNKDKFKKQMIEIEKKILVDNVVADILKEIEDPNDEQIKNFFKENGDLFKRSEAVYKTRFIGTQTVTGSWKLRQRITDQRRVNKSKTPYMDVERSVRREKGFTVTLNDYRTIGEYPECFRKTISTMRVGTTSVPNRCDDQVVVVHLEERELEGATKFYHEVENEIAQVMKKETLKNKLNQMIERTKGRLLISVDLENIPQKQ
ncbi:MAG: hypothetical protein OCC49_14325 [Fibrobacterales bacterium]